MNKIPIFKSIEEEAEFWDTHDTEEFADEFEEVEVKFARPLKHKWMLTIELDEETFNQMKKLAEGVGKEPGVLIRSWVLEHLKE
ncbi:MAG: CopG family antitoxin [Euryarchaeota archaeon]|nr:CopG family antitoxin [Euryarchaeota archaeon]